MKSKLPLKTLDFAVIALSLAITAGAAFAVYARPPALARAHIRGEGRSWIFPLDAEERIRVPGPLGETVVEIRGGRVRVLSSPCVNQTCVAAGHIHRQGEWAACLPNRVFVAIEGSADNAETPDAAAW
jgi:hypothetical protein